MTDITLSNHIKALSITTTGKIKQLLSTVGLAGLSILGIYFPSPAAAAELFITTETPRLNAMVEEGSVRVVISYSSFEDYNEPDNIRYRIFYEGEPVASVSSSARFPNGRAGVSVEDLDSDGIAEVRIIHFSGGHRCCLETTVYGLVGQSGFSEVDTRLVDGGLTGGHLEDINGDGYSEVIKSDEAFFYKFASFAGSSAPPRILTYRQGSFTDTTREFANELREHIANL